MITELGHFSLILALALGTISLLGLCRRKPLAPSFVGYVSHAQSALLGLAFVCLVLAFARSDFSVMSVAHHSNSATPLIYKIAATWGHHEGSMVLWVLILSLYNLAFARNSKHIPSASYSSTLHITQGVLLLFLVYIIFCANPFDRLMPFPLNAGELNPLLQDPSLTFHPILLYLGFLGFVIPFALAASQGFQPISLTQLIDWSKPWLYLSWGLLTLGIISGSWWAYYELGWGGWWFWDPVESASLLPWLCATALLHAQRKDSAPRTITLLTALCFLLCVASTWIIRGGAVVSIHSFALDPTRNIFLLAIFLCCVCLCVPAIYKSPNQSEDEPLWSESFFKKTGSLILLYFLFIVAWGIFFPIAYEKFTSTTLSLGMNYFKKLFCYPMLLVFFLMGIGPSFTKSFSKGLVLTILGAGTTFFFTQDIPWIGKISILGSTWLILLTLVQMVRPKRNLLALGAHLGIGILALGVSINQFGQRESIHTMHVGETFTMGKTQITLKELHPTPAKNYLAYRAIFSLHKDGKETTKLAPERRIYFATQTEHSETAIHRTCLSTLSIILGETHDRSLWMVRTYTNPFIILIWLGGFIVALSGLLAFLNRRRHK